MAKRILIYTNHYYPEQFKINELVDWLSEENIDIRVITGLPNYPRGKIYKNYDVLSNFFRSNPKINLTINRMFLIPRGNASYFMLLLNYVSFFLSCLTFTLFLALFKKKYDTILVHHTSPFFIAIHPIIYGFFHRTKKIIWELDLWPETLRDLKLVKSNHVFKIIENLIVKVYSYYNLILVGSLSFKKIVENRFKKKIIYFPNWANNEIENPNIKNIDINLPKDSLKIMYTGNIGTVQNFENLLITMEKLRSEKVFWIFIGDGRFKIDFQKLVNKKNLDNNSLFINNVSEEEIPSYCNYADSMYLSLTDKGVFKNTVPAKLQTYLALGKPILAVISGEAATIIKNADCGYVNEDNDFNKFSDLVLKMSKLTKKDRLKMAQNSLNYYKNNFASSLRKNEIINYVDSL